VWCEVQHTLLIDLNFHFIRPVGGKEMQIHLAVLFFFHIECAAELGIVYRVRSCDVAAYFNRLCVFL
jgi:hypothetical protein